MCFDIAFPYFAHSGQRRLFVLRWSSALSAERRPGQKPLGLHGFEGALRTVTGSTNWACSCRLLSAVPSTNDRVTSNRGDGSSGCLSCIQYGHRGNILETHVFSTRRWQKPLLWVWKGGWSGSSEGTQHPQATLQKLIIADRVRQRPCGTDLQETSALTIVEAPKKKHPSEIVKYSREQLLRQDQVSQSLLTGSGQQQPRTPASLAC